MSNTTVYFLSLAGVIIGCLGIGLIAGVGISRTAAGAMLERLLGWNEDDEQS
jgi:hypothetical protein